MARKQGVQKNYTQMPNVLVDYWMARVSSPQYKILSTIARKTIGWQKSEDAISIRQLENITGLSHPTVIKGIKYLVARDLIFQRKEKSTEGDDAPSVYSINFVVLEQCEGTKKEKPRSQESLEGSLTDLPPVDSEFEYGAQNDLPRVVEMPTNPGGQNPLPTKESSSTKETFIEEIFPKSTAIKDPYSSSSSSSLGFVDWKKTKMNEGWADEEIEEALGRYAVQPSGSIACPRAWLETTLQSVRDSNWQKAEAAKLQEAQKQEAEREMRERAEYHDQQRQAEERKTQERQRQLDEAEAERIWQIKRNEALAGRFQGRSWLEYVPGKTYVKLIVNGESYAGCLSFNEPDFCRIFLECMEKEATPDDYNEAKRLIELME